MQKCSICGFDFSEYGNNAEPVNSGRCCNACNSTVVIPARLARMGFSKTQTIEIGKYLGEGESDER